MPQLDALVIFIIMANHEVRRIYVDNDAAVNILFMECFQKLGLKKNDLKPCFSLQSFTQVEVKPAGMITLPVIVRHKTQRKTSIVDFYVVQTPFTYNIILGRNWNRAICFTYNLVIQFLTEAGTGEVKGDQ